MFIRRLYKLVSLDTEAPMYTYVVVTAHPYRYLSVTPLGLCYTSEVDASRATVMQPWVYDGR